ncbi:MAG: histidinol dehydrogenase [Deltaproteobacteria bacterium]|nr:histidinol dehydrogenase [Deltaproteobacteria bacterium]MBW2134845.1 histidinol dehydrogenase [Deltaproteobacteria bacterium]
MVNLIVEKLRELSFERRQAILTRSREDISAVLDDVKKIVEAVRQHGDSEALEIYGDYKHDFCPHDLIVTAEEIQAAYDSLDPKIIEALQLAAANIEKFHQAQVEREMWAIEVRPGIMAGRLYRPLERVGCYIPGGLAKYPSTVLMTIIPARVAGVREIIACTPPDQGMIVHPATLAAAHLAGAQQIFKIGGPWAIAAMAYGTELVPKTDKIVGPGNKYVTAAKLLVFGEVAIDSPAGPSEALILADDTAEARYVVADFLSQAEHDPDAAAVLVTTSEKLAHRVVQAIIEELPELPRQEILQAAIEHHSAVLVAHDLAEALEFVNLYAPEHLQIITREPFEVLPRIRHAGSIFLGPYAPIPAGDYASGTNHVLPTGQCARMFSGLSVDDFIKKPTFQHLSFKGLQSIKDAVIILAEAEGLPLHARTIAERFRYV